MPGLLLSVALLVGLQLALINPAQARSYDDILAAGRISVAVYRDFPPYAYEVDGKATGLDVELAREIAAGLGVELDLHWMIADENLDDDLRNHVWKGHYLARIEDEPMLRREVADVMLRVPYDREFAYKVDPDGRVINDLVHFFGPYQREHWGLVYDSQRMESFENLAVFQYERVGVEIDSLPDFYLSSAFRGRLRNNVEHYSSTALALDAMAQGRVPAVMGMRSQLQWGVGGLAGSERIKTADIPFPNLTKRHWDVGMAVKDAHRQLAYRIEDVIDQLVANGQMKALFGRFGVDYSRPDRYRVQ
ncbi:amino acid ABC transporter substrate-binding protein [Motiliproteus coralliicola]|uniref:Amino acid ABC transporter substrate-binding protein n=2 Tax=Motiliproteus coralliicola TaxID=2283196 RepID=A0A369WQ16_9GAMM|nr:amino acid ABC transporter substrate-binding protein [Motiliproteus coralliicola]